MNTPQKGNCGLLSLECFLPRMGYAYMLRGFKSPFLDRKVVTFVHDMPSYYVCAICGAVHAKMWPLPCLHAVCGFCRDSLIVNLTENQLEDGGALDETALYRDCALCPADSLPFPLASLYIEPGDLSFLEEEPVLCLNAELGCPFEGQLRLLEFHYSDCCFGPRIAYDTEDM
ncbi:hypothetical protein HPB51_001709 [Rhipicephalus microplus]|uniref:RING-type domain-containing protein n=1 Tax=Rhipicephalus microplus TaxID=6941 RepID=A0A9J6DEK7_RHIMP|nr:hypothetical protein HPB51_001709 [Rhipicephalus microplus]